MESTHPPAADPASAQSDRHELVARLQGSEIFRDYQRAFQSITGLPLVLRAAGSFQAGLAGARGGNSFCALMATRNKTCSACLQLQARLEASATAGPSTLECFAGLHESAVPVRVGEAIVGYLQTGQVLFQAPSAVRFSRAARAVAAREGCLDDSALRAAYARARVVDKAQYLAILRMLDIFAQQLSSLSNQLMLKQTMAEPPVIARAREFIARHVTEELDLEVVARAVGMSTCYFCKSFRKVTGLTFTDYLSRVRVEAVKELLLDPYKRISEAAFAAGFSSLSQFNRVFQRVAGESPSTYRDRLHGAGHAPARHHGRLVAA